MEISSIDPAVTAPASALTALAALDSNAAVDAPLLEFTFVGNTSSIVNFSPLAQFLAAAVLTQTQQSIQTQQQPVSANSAPNSAANTAPSFQQLAENTIFFVNAFNNFQASSIDSFANPLQSAFENALLQEIQSQIAQTGPDNTQSFINSLAQLGINFQGPESPTNPNQFQINWATLQAAFQVNPTQTATTLTNAFQGLSAIEEQLMLSQSTQGQLNVFDILATQAATTGTAVNNPVPINPAPTTSTTPTATNGTNTAADVGNAQSAVQQQTIDLLAATAVAAYRAGEILTNPPGERALKNPAAQLNPDVEQVRNLNPTHPDSKKSS